MHRQRLSDVDVARRVSKGWRYTSPVTVGRVRKGERHASPELALRLVEVVGGGARAIDLVSPRNRQVIRHRDGFRSRASNQQFGGGVPDGRNFGQDGQ